MAHVVTACELPLVARFLASQLPASLKLHGEALGLLHGIDAAQDVPGDDLVINTTGFEALQAVDAAVDGEGEFDGVSAAVSRRHYGSVDRPLHLQLSFFATDEAAAAELFEVVLNDLRPAPASLMFAGLESRFLSVARAQFGGGQLGLSTASQAAETQNLHESSSHWVSPCLLLWRPPKAHPPCPDVPVPVGCTLGPLSAADSYLVNDTWEYGKTEVTRVQRVMPCIEHQLSMGLRLEETGELVAWAVADHPYGAVGKVFTREGHRRKGYSAVVCSALTKLVEADAEGERPRCAAPFCFIVADNGPSLSLFKDRLGYVEAEACSRLDWVGF
eukprot:COSAG02_NODE_36_length_48934_cov_144.851029_9_plen_331_part_00